MPSGAAWQGTNSGFWNLSLLRELPRFREEALLTSGLESEIAAAAGTGNRLVLLAGRLPAISLVLPDGLTSLLETLKEGWYPCCACWVGYPQDPIEGAAPEGKSRKLFRSDYPGNPDAIIRR